jgi:hypothetical protein
MALAMEIKANDQNVQFMGLEIHIHQLIVRYLDVKELGIFSRLNQMLFHNFRKPFLIFRAYELKFGFSEKFEEIEQRARHAKKCVSILAEDALHKRSLVLMTTMTDFTFYLQLLMKPESVYDLEEKNIMKYVKILKHDRKLSEWIMLKHDRELRNSTILHCQPDDFYQDGFCAYSIENHSLYFNSGTDDIYFLHQKNINIPLVIHYLLDGKDHIDFLAEYPNCILCESDCQPEIYLRFFSSAREVYPSVTFSFILNKNSNLITKVLMTNKDNECHFEQDTYDVKDGILIGPDFYNWDIKPTKIKSIFTSSSLLKLQNKHAENSSNTQLLCMYGSLAFLLLCLKKAL